MVKNFDKWILVETVKCLLEKGDTMNLKDLHDVCHQAKKHKTIRQFGSILRLKGEFVEYEINGETMFLIGWREGPERLYVLSEFVDENPMPVIQKKLTSRQTNRPKHKIVIEVENHRS